MAKSRDTSTDRLSNVIEVVELGRRSGLLAVERGAGATLEQGEIYFISGRATFAATDHLRGREALAALGQWGPCRFAFEPAAPQPIPNLSGQMGTVRAPIDRRAAPQPGVPSAVGGTSSFGWGAPPGQPAYPPASQPGPAISSGTWGSSQPGSANATGPLGRRPRRAPDVRDLMATVTAYNLTRSHRTILLLADGAHNVLDLARLSSKSIDEVTELLAELEARGLIYYYE
jgi:Domain of unknown function (DUF4388)